MGEVTSISDALGAGLRAPSALTKEHEIGKFSSGSPPLDDWLRNRALKAEGVTSRTYVVCSGRRVVAYYTLAAGAIVRAELPRRLQRNTPEIVPIMVLGRLAVDTAMQGKGLGAGMLKEAIVRCVQASEIAGIRAMLVHAKDDDAVKFYKRYGFVEAALGPQTLLLPIETLRASIKK